MPGRWRARFRPQSGLALRPRRIGASCRYNAKNGDWAKAVAAADELIRRHLYTESVAETVAAVLIEKASWLGPGKLDRPGRAARDGRPVPGSVRGRLRAITFRPVLALAGFTRAALLDELGRRREAISIWGDLFDRCAAIPRPGAELTGFRFAHKPQGRHAAARRPDQTRPRAPDGL